MCVCATLDSGRGSGDGDGDGGGCCEIDWPNCRRHTMECMLWRASTSASAVQQNKIPSGLLSCYSL